MVEPASGREFARMTSRLWAGPGSPATRRSARPCSRRQSISFGFLSRRRSMRATSALIDHITRPGVLDMVSIGFDNPHQAAAFAPPDWLGPEITTEPSFGRQMIALHGIPEF